MSLLALLAASSVTTIPDPDPEPSEFVQPNRPEPQPGASALSAPYRALSHMSITVPDGSGQATHPAVYDFGSNQWNGYRYWFAYTPYAYGNDTLENPCIAASNTTTEWTVPDGLTNPIDPYDGSHYHSDTELEYDPDTGRMYCYYRTTFSDTDCRINSQWSTDGVTWQGKKVLYSAHVLSNLSPAVVRVASGDWRMFCIGFGGTYAPSVRTATNPEGPWSAPTPISIPPGLGGSPWHVDVNLTPSGDFHMILDCRTTWGLAALTSADGITWQGGPIFLTGASGGWDESVYRATMTLADNGLDYDIWYGAFGPSGVWGIGHTQAPRALWTTPTP